MKNNIDKDIETLKKRETMSLIQIIRTFKREGIENFAVVKLESLDNVLSELERYKKAYELETYERQKFIDELETYKKIAEKLADYIVITDINEDIICADIPEEICEQRAIGDCKQCIIDWARKEVENEQNNNT